MAVMDYSLVQRIIDGTGQILDTTPGSPDSGSYVTEAQLRDWIKAGILFSGYYYNGNFYSDSGHTSPLAKVEGALYVDKTNSNKALYVCLSSTYQSLTEEAQVQAIIDGLNDGTIVPLKAKQDQNGNVIDTTYETKADANDLKNAIDDLEDTKADKTGYYAGLTAGNAEQLLSSTLIHDTAIYTDRTAGGGEDIGNKSYQKSITGVMINWNQKVRNGNFASGSEWDTDQATKSVSNNTITIVNNSVASSCVKQTGVSFTKDHRYLVRFEASSSDKTSSRFAIYDGAVLLYCTHSDMTSSFKTYWFYKKATNTTSNGQFQLARTTSVSEAGTISYRKVQCYDITSMFGAAIADYLATLTTSNAVALLQSNGFFRKDYYPLTANPTLQPVCVSSKENTGFNQFDYDTGKARILANVEYKIEGTYTALAFADLNGNALSITPDSDGLFTSTVECVLTVTGGDDSSTCVFIHWDDSRDGEYEPFKKYSYPMDSSVELRGIPKLDANNELYYDGDEYASDGSVTRKMGSYTFTGNETWANSGANAKTCDVISSIVKSLGAGNISNILFPTLLTNTFNNIYNGTVTGAIGLSTSGLLIISNSDYSNRETLITGKTIVFELATPTTQSADPYTYTQVCDNWGTESFTDGLTRDVFVPPMAVADYTQNLRDKLETSPSTPDADGLYLMKRENGQNTYVAYTSPIPTESTDGTYVLKATVADGAMTLAWVAEE